MDEAERERSPWRKNLHVLWFCTFVAGMAFSEIMPFLSLYISSFGDYTKAQVTMYSGVVYAADFLVSAIASPLWGLLADRKGRKIMLLRSSLGMGISLTLMGFATTVWQMVALRALQGVFAGYISNAQALVASQTPRKHSGASLSTLMTGPTSGMLLGPVFGGILAQIFSIRLTFFITGGLLLVTFFMSWGLVEEKFKPVAPKPKEERSFNPLAAFPNPKLILVLLSSTLIVQFGNISISPIISLYVKELMHNVGPITVVAGIIAALPGISNIIASPRLGRYGDKHGSGKVLLFGYIFATIMYLPQGFVTSVWMLGLLRLMIGISDGALFPEIQTLLTKNTPVELTSTVFSWNQSFQSVGNMLGSLVGGWIAGIFNYNAVFITTAALMLINLALVWWLIPEIRQHQSQTSNA
ncbi:MFS transporter [Levilactobacillus suantsaii]|uniref:MFS transporter n=1 Tax=Levilactobacillus suantsaii TaxID=2292255 RepID=A0A4Q0VIE7_9LACO|nr:MFS transporter [Levilactobacillus suantsaii]QMU08943.1 MFS transporter [Levilactobacillus suantsaii]RXI78235.1 MFS transporter [Levilactobacillus suantsaii]